MAILQAFEIRTLLAPYYAEPPNELVDQLSTYLDLLVKWNARTNLTAIRDPAEIVQRHFGESLFAAQQVPPFASTLLDLGSGAGFPGLPMQLARPELHVTLAESQNKKAAFLREAVRTLGVKAEVWAGRIVHLPQARSFDVVALRAVDDPAAALLQARARLNRGGALLHLTGAGLFELEGLVSEEFRVPQSRTVLRVSRLL